MSIYTKSGRKRDEPFMDGLPEQMRYADTGCEVSMSCLDCPLPRCRFDDPAWYQAYKIRERDEEIAWAYRYENLHVFEVASRFGISVRTVHRALRRMQTMPLAA